MEEEEELIQFKNQLIKSNHLILSKILPKEFKFNCIRITNGSKMNFVVKDSLIHLQDTERPPLILHTFNPPTPITKKESKNLEKQQIPITSTPTLNNATSLPLPIPSIASIPLRLPPKVKTTLINESKNSLSSLPKLISLIEIIKRSYLPPFTSLKPSDLVAQKDLKGKGKEVVLVEEGGENAEEIGEAMEGIELLTKSEPKEKHKRSRKKLRTGLHQYTLIGALEDLGILVEEDEDEDEDEEEDEIDEILEQARQDDIVKEWLEGGSKGTRRPRRKHTPYMIVVLSTKPLPELMRSKQFTHQAPLPISQTLKALASKKINQKNSTTTKKVEKRKVSGEGEVEGEGEEVLELVGKGIEKPKKKRKRSKKNKGKVDKEKEKNSKGKKDDMELEIIGGGMDVEDEVVA